VKPHSSPSKQPKFKISTFNKSPTSAFSISIGPLK
jgi:hypothetical protein